MWRRKRPAPPEKRLYESVEEILLAPDPRAATDAFDWVAGASAPLALSHPVLSRALEQLGWIRHCRVARLRSMLTARREGNRLRIRCVDEDPIRAGAVARTVAAAYAAWTRERAQESLRLAARRLAREWEALETRRRQMAEGVAGITDLSEAARRSEEYSALRAQAEACRARVAELRDAFHAIPGSVRLPDPRPAQARQTA